MSNLVYLLIAVVISVVGVLAVWYRGRPPTSPNSSIDQFSEKMRALAPQDDELPGPTDPLRRRG
jgi:hypothetical protein